MIWPLYTNIHTYCIYPLTAGVNKCEDCLEILKARATAAQQATPILTQFQFLITLRVSRYLGENCSLLCIMDD